jgi:alpha-galactosidase
MKALLGLGDLITNVNIPNYGQIPNLPLGSIVETNAVFRNDRVEPIIAGNVPDAIYGMITNHISNQNAITKAALTNDKKLAFSAFINDPLVNLSYEEAQALFDEMIDNTKEYLNEAFWA